MTIKGRLKWLIRRSGKEFPIQSFTANKVAGYFAVKMASPICQHVIFPSLIALISPLI